MKDKRLYYYIGGVLVVLLLICLIFFFTKDKNPTNTSSGTNTSGSTKNDLTPAALQKNISYTSALTKNGSLVVFVKNSNKVVVELEVEVEYYDANGLLVKSDSDSLYAVDSNNEVAIEFWLTPDSFDNYKIYVDVNATNAISYSNKLEIVHNNTGKEITVQVKNPTENIIDNIGVSIVYYLNDQVVGIDTDSAYDIKPNRSGNFEFNYPTDRRYNNVLFDKYKVFVNEAYSNN